ncbi:MAG TPA: tetratricopeptide repeat protein [Planctomycetota bacterium]|nr:tetratricopeptide repeat protein [Planctomycetota bacterium]
MRLLVDGIREWLGCLAGEGSTRGHVGLLEGEPGQGQSEVLRALTQVCRDLGLCALHGRASRTAAFPPGVIGTLVEQCLEAYLKRGTAGTAEISVAPENLAEIGKVLEPHPVLSSVLPLPPLGPDLDRSRLIDAIARSFIDLSAKGPLLVIVEDIESADPFSLEVLRHLSRMISLRKARGKAPRILIIANISPGARVDQILEVPRVLIPQVEAFRILLRGYSREDLRDAAIKILGDEGTLSFRERVFRLTAGNARHIRWILWRVLETGGLGEGGGKYSDSDLQFRRLVRNRFATLSPAEKERVSVLAVLGQPCDADAPRDQPLEARGWLRLVPPALSGGVPAASLADPDVAEIVLEEIDAASRAAIHSSLGALLLERAMKVERWFADAACHLCLAGDLERGLEAALSSAKFLERLGCVAEACEILEEVWNDPRFPSGKPVRGLQLEVARLREAASDLQGAVRMNQELLENAASPQEEARLQRTLGDLHGKLKDRAAQTAAYESGLRALDRGSAPSSAPERIVLFSRLANVALDAGDLEKSTVWLDQCLDIVSAKGLDSASDHVEVYRMAEEVRFRQHDYEQAAELERCLLECHEKSVDIPGQLQSLRHLAHLHVLRGKREESEACLTRALAIAKESGSRWLMAGAHSSLGIYKRDQGDPGAALKHLRQAMVLFGDLAKDASANRISSVVLGLELELGLFSSAGKTAMTLVRERLSCGGPGAGGVTPLPAVGREARRARISQLEKKMTQKDGERLVVSEALVLGVLLEEDGRLVDAQRVYQDCLHTEPIAPDPHVAARALYSLGRIAALRGEYDAALRFLEQSLQLRGANPSREALGEVYLAVSSIFLERGDFNRAFEYGLRGLRSAFESGDTEGLINALTTLSAFLIEAGLSVPASAMSRSAFLMARAAGAQRWEAAAGRLCVRALSMSAGADAEGEVKARWLELEKLLEWPAETCQVKLELGWESFGKNDFQAALQYAREGIEVARSIGLRTVLDELLHLVGVIESEARNPRKNFLRALEALEQALAGAEARRSPRLRWEVLHNMARVYGERGKADLAEEYQKRADEVECIIFGSLPPALREVRWCSRTPGVLEHEPVRPSRSSGS